MDSRKLRGFQERVQVPESRQERGCSQTSQRYLVKEQERRNAHEFKLKKFLSKVRRNFCSEGCQVSHLEFRDLHFGDNKN